MPKLLRGGAIVIKYNCGHGVVEKSKSPQRKNMDQENKNDEGMDLSGALKDSGAGVKLDEYRMPRSYYPGTPKIIQWVIKYSGGYIKDEKQANYFLIGFVAVAIIFSLFLIFDGGGSTGNPKDIKILPAVL